MIMSVRDAVIQQKSEYESKRKERYVDRAVTVSGLKSNLIKVITGPRRAGKSFFAIHHFAETANMGYVNFDDERLAGSTDYDEIIAAVNFVYDNPSHILFDEIQNLPRWELLVNRLARQGHNLILTGSNSHMLSQELSTHLTGRYLQTTILPFSFSEYLSLKDQPITSPGKREHLARYAEQGGFPELLIKNLNAREYLGTLFDSIVYKDIVKRFNIRFAQGLDDLAVYLLSNVAQEYSYTTLSRLTRCRSVHTVQKYLGYLEEAYIFFSVPRFSYKFRKQVSANKKIYCIDNGFITAKAFQFSQNRGRLLENLVAVELKRRELSWGTGLFFWKNVEQEEVDFVVKQGNMVSELIQVCADATGSRTRQREVRALIKAGNELNCKNLIVLTENEERTDTEEWFGIQGTIRFIPLWKWLLVSPEKNHKEPEPGAMKKNERKKK
jgi:predicted AAA+ superfamily ATPase